MTVALCLAGYMLGAAVTVYYTIVAAADWKDDKLIEGILVGSILWPITLPILVACHLAVKTVERRDAKKALAEAEKREQDKLLKEAGL